MTSFPPFFSVIMPVYNGGRYVEDAVRSVLRQSFGNFEFVIVNDGSVDDSKEILERLATQDERIHLHHQDNQGITPALNQGLKWARGKYIARMDADDVTLPGRFEQQVRFLEANPDVGIVGTQVEILDAEGEVTMQWAFPTSPDAVAWQLLFRNCLTHPSIMMRRSLVDKLGGYASWAQHVEDYELYTRALLTSKVANLPQVLHRLRRWEGSITKRKREAQKQATGEVAAMLHKTLLGNQANASFAHFLVHMQEAGVRRASQDTGMQNAKEIAAYLRALYAAFRRRFRGRRSNVETRQRVLFQLERLSAEIRKQDGALAEFVSQLRSKLMAPRREIGPWMAEVVKTKIAQ